MIPSLRIRSLPTPAIRFSLLNDGIRLGYVFLFGEGSGSSGVILKKRADAPKMATAFVFKLFFCSCWPGSLSCFVGLNGPVLYRHRLSWHGQGIQRTPAAHVGAGKRLRLSIPGCGFICVAMVKQLEAANRFSILPKLNIMACLSIVASTRCYCSKTLDLHAAVSRVPTFWGPQTLNPKS